MSLHKAIAHGKEKRKDRVKYVFEVEALAKRDYMRRKQAAREQVDDEDDGLEDDLAYDEWDWMDELAYADGECDAENS